MNSGKPRNENLIFCAYAQVANYLGGINLKNQYQAGNTYLKNAIVALVSAKKSNPKSDVALVTNIDIQTPYKDICEKNSIIVYKESFDAFRFDGEYKWALAFYKLCALKKMLLKEYENYLLVDVDVYINKTLDDLWVETSDNIMLYDINHRLSNNHCKSFNDEVVEFCGVRRAITNYGGEFVAANARNLIIFIEKCERIFHKMLNSSFRTNLGDEFIIRIAADRLRNNVKNGGAYIYIVIGPELSTLSVLVIYIILLVLCTFLPKKKEV